MKGVSAYDKKKNKGNTNRPVTIVENVRSMFCLCEVIARTNASISYLPGMQIS